MGKIHNIDKFGNCVVCHKNLIKNVVLNGKQEGVFDADKDEAYLKLNNGSLMPISICRPCKDSTDLTDPTVQTTIMEAVNNGWELEMDQMDRNPDKYPDWNSAKKQKLQEFYQGLSIVGYEANHVMR